MLSFPICKHHFFFFLFILLITIWLKIFVTCETGWNLMKYIKKTTHHATCSQEKKRSNVLSILTIYHSFLPFIISNTVHFRSAVCSFVIQLVVVNLAIPIIFIINGKPVCETKKNKRKTKREKFYIQCCWMKFTQPDYYYQTKKV